MIVRPRLDPKLVITVTWKRVTALAVVSCAAVVLYTYAGNNVAVPDLAASIFGTLLAILLGFRVNSAYERWWEARRIWGSIINESRSLGRELISFVDDATVRRILIRRLIAFPIATAHHLRGLDARQKLSAYIDDEELNAHYQRSNVPYAILAKETSDINALRSSSIINDFQQMQIEARLTALTDSLGACERIKKTVFPRDYSVYTTFFVTAYSFILPFIIVDSFNWQTIPWTVFIGFAMFSIDRLARAIENPFENRFNDTPMNAISRTIEIDLLQMLGETDIPQPLQPDNGYLL